MKKEQGKKLSQPIVKDDKSGKTTKVRGAIPVKPTILSDEDLDKVAGGLTRTWIADDTTTNIMAPRSPTKYTTK